MLGDDAAEGLGDHDADLVPLVDGEDVENTVECSRGVSGVEGGEDEVTGFCGGEGERDCLKVTHFTHHDDVGVFPEGTTEGAWEGLGMFTNFALVDVAATGFEDILDGILEGEDVVHAVAVDEVHEGGHGR